MIFCKLGLLLGVFLLPGVICDLGGLLGSLLGGSQDTSYCTANPPSSPSSVQCSGDVYSNLATGRTVHGSEDRPGGVLPSWINLKLALKGQQFANKFFTPVIFCHLMGLMTLFAYPDASNVLMSTGASADVEDAAKRYISTATQVFVWYQNFLTNPNPENMITSLKNVRTLHKKAALKAAATIANNQPLFNKTYWEGMELKTILSGPFYQDLFASSIPKNQRGVNPLPPSSWTNITSVPVNQQGQALTQFAFVGFPVYFSQQMGIFASDDEIWAFNHLWAVIGYAIGIDDQYNICLQPDLATTRATYKKIWEGYFVPSLFLMKDNKAFTAFTDVMVQSFETLAQGLVTGNALLHQLLSTILEIPTPNSLAAMSAQDKAVDATLSGWFETFPVNSLTLPAANTLFNTAVFVMGSQRFGANYTTQETRAKYVFYPDVPKQP